MSDIDWKRVRSWTRAALDAREVLEERGRETVPLVVIERLHARACEQGEWDTVSVSAGHLASILARLLGTQIRCANGCVNPHVPDDWDGVEPLFCTDCYDAASREGA